MGEVGKSADWLLQHGDGRLPIQTDDIIHLPGELCVSTVNNLIHLVFADLSFQYNDVAWVSSRALLCPRNEMVNDMNNHVLDMLPGNMATCFSVDSM